MDDQRTRFVPTRLGPGTRLNDTYEIDGRIGSGGMGEIYRGHNIHTGDAVAIKLIRVDLEEDETALGLFQREAAALNHLYNEAIVRYYVFSNDPRVGRHYLAMEFVDGPSLSQLLERGPLGFEAVEALRRRVASGLQAAHERGVIHRDVSPDNIIMPDGDVTRAKIIDFGIARSTTSNKATIIGSGFAGKYNYVSPEQLGLAGGEVTAKSDIYSFGLVLAEALVGRPLDMGGREADVIEKRRRVPDLSAVDARLRPLIAEMLDPDPAGRPESMAAVARWSGADELPPSLRRAPDARPHGGAAVAAAPKPPRRVLPRVLISVGSASLLCGAAVIAYVALQPPTPQPQNRPNHPQLTPVPPPPVPTPSPTPTPSPQPTPPPQPAPLPTPQPTPAPTPTPTPQPLPAPTPTPAPPPRNDAARLLRYVSDYPGGQCFYLAPLRASATSVGVDGFAKSTSEFDAFLADFTRANGFEPDLTAQKVYSTQCAAVDFLRRIGKDGDAAPVLDIRSISLKVGQSLAGEVRGYDRRTVALLLVQEDGMVRNLSRQAKDDGDAEIFDVPMVRHVNGGPFPQMLVAIASPQPLVAVSFDAPVAAETLFREIAAEAAAKKLRLGAAAKLFLLRE